MAKGNTDTAALARTIIEDVRSGKFSPVYLLMGEEPYYIDMVCDAIVEHALEDEERDFNQTICYGLDVNAELVVTAARRYPMFAERQLVVVKEAQMMRDVEALSVYLENPLDSTVLVICMKGKSADKRKALYKNASKKGTVLESTPIRDYEIARWISSYYTSLGLSIDPEAAALLGEFAGTDLSKIAIETDKLRKNLPEGATFVSVKDIEENVGLTRQFSVFELTKVLSTMQIQDALRIAAHIGTTPKFALPAVTAPLFTHFYRILKLHAMLAKNPRVSPGEKAAALGLNPFFVKEYDMAVKYYPIKKCMAAIAAIRDYDYKSKGGDSGQASQAELLTELVLKIVNYGMN